MSRHIGEYMEIKLISEGIKLIDTPSGSLFFVILILWVVKLIREYFSKNRVKHTETLTNLINYMKENQIKDFFIVEQLFLDHFKVQIPYKGIRLFLNSDSPTELIFMFKNSRPFATFSSDYKKVEFYKNKKDLKLKKLIAWFQYAILGGLGFYMLVTSHHFIELNPLQYISWFVISLYLCAIGFLGLDSITSIDKAKQLVAKYA